CFVLVFAIAMLAGGSLDTLIRHGVGRTSRIALGLMAALAAGLIAIALARAPSWTHAFVAGRALAGALLAGGVAVWLVRSLAARRARPAFAIAF
ncbi:hypothetical protein ABTH20_19385, partial [Acinetobacter baumannii]